MESSMNISKFISMKSKIKIKTVVRPVSIYRMETRADISSTVLIIRTIEMRIVRIIHGKTLTDRARNEYILEQSSLLNIRKRTRKRRK